MEQVFSVYKIDRNPISKDTRHLQIHGRALKLLSLNQVIYLTNDHNYPGTIVGIVSYGKSLSEVEPVMGCSITVEVDSKLPENVDALYS